MPTQTNYKITLRRRTKDGKLQTATYKLEHLHSTGSDEEQMSLLAGMEVQANESSAYNGDVSSVRVWVEEES